MSLNIGGILGAVLGFAVFIILVFTATPDGPAINNNDITMFITVGGIAFLANFLWSSVLGRKSGRDSSSDKDLKK